MDGNPKRAWPALVFGLVLLLAVPVSGGNSEPVAAVGGKLTSGGKAEEAEAELSSESLFDLLFGTRKSGSVIYDIPFPFTALTRRIETHFAADEVKPSSLLQVLIPLGRSLQRDAAAPEYFKYPRVIVAVDRSPAAPPGGRRLLLKDRLFLGYQEKAKTIEVISYNEKAGRYEFQVVQDYAPGLTPRVSYASRILCMGCHQNAGPIWPEPPWDETNSNPQIVALLQEKSGEAAFQGVPFDLSRQGVDAAFRVAASIDRANLFAPHQELWQRACGTAVRCRGEIFASLLRYRLSGNRGSVPLSNVVEKTFEAGWRESWPGGLAIEDHRLPNRDPLDDTIGIAGDLDPLEPRPSSRFLKPSDAGAIERVIAGLSEFLLDPDLRALDSYLFDAGRDATNARLALKADCAFTKADLGGWTLQVRFTCESGDPDGLSMEGQFYVKPGEATAGTIERLWIGEAEKFIKLAITGPELALSEPGGQLLLAVEQPIGAIHARLKSGQAVETLALRWNTMAQEDADPSEELRPHPANGTSVLTIVDDFALVSGAVDDLIQQTESGSDHILSNKPIQGSALMRALFAELGMRSPERGNAN